MTLSSENWPSNSADMIEAVGKKSDVSKYKLNTGQSIVSLKFPIIFLYKAKELPESFSLTERDRNSNSGEISEYSLAMFEIVLVKEGESK